jgi:hypothetical protein
MMDMELHSVQDDFDLNATQDDFVLTSIQDDFKLNALFDVARSAGQTFTFVYYLTDTTGNYLTDTAGNRLVGYGTTTSYPQILNAIQDNFLLHAR